MNEQTCFNHGGSRGIGGHDTYPPAARFAQVCPGLSAAIPQRILSLKSFKERPESFQHLPSEPSFAVVCQCVTIFGVSNLGSTPFSSVLLSIFPHTINRFLIEA